MAVRLPRFAVATLRETERRHVVVGVVAALAHVPPLELHRRVPHRADRTLDRDSTNRGTAVRAAKRAVTTAFTSHESSPVTSFQPAGHSLLGTLARPSRSPVFGSLHHNWT